MEIFKKKLVLGFQNGLH